MSCTSVPPGTTTKIVIVSPARTQRGHNCLQEVFRLLLLQKAEDVVMDDLDLRLLSRDLGCELCNPGIGCHELQPKTSTSLSNSARVFLSRHDGVCKDTDVSLQRIANGVRCTSKISPETVNMSAELPRQPLPFGPPFRIITGKDLNVRRKVAGVVRPTVPDLQGGHKNPALQQELDGLILFDLLKRVPDQSLAQSEGSTG